MRYREYALRIGSASVQYIGPERPHRAAPLPPEANPTIMPPFFVPDKVEPQKAFPLRIFTGAFFFGIFTVRPASLVIPLEKPHHQRKVARGAG